MTLIRIGLETKAKLTTLLLFPRGENQQKHTAKTVADSPKENLQCYRFSNCVMNSQDFEMYLK